MLKRQINHFLAQKIPDFPLAELLVAVSGGLDSMVLLHLMGVLVKKGPLKFRVIHFNHHLRGRYSDADERFVAQNCRQQALELIVGQGRDILDQRHELGLSLEDAARQVRYAFFDRCLKKRPEAWLLTAHTASDQAETVIMNLLRGSGLRGLKGIPAQRQRILRPLLAVSREEIEEYARHHNVSFVEDSSNASLEFTRNRIRHQVLPVLKHEAGMDLDKRLSVMAAGLAADLSVIDTLAEDFISQWVDIDKNENLLTINRRQLTCQHPGLLPYILEQCIQRAGNRKQLSRKTLLTLAKMAGNETGKTLVSFRLANNLIFEVHREHIIIRYAGMAVEPPGEFSRDIPGTGCYPLPGHRGILKVYQADQTGKNEYLHKSGSNYETIDADTISFPLVIRSWKPGDIFFPIGMHGRRKKVKNFFTDCKIPIDQKQNIPILCHDNRIIWVVGHRLDERFAIKPTTKTFLKIKYDAEQHH
ncbi:MAG: tRNA lysidine(34) synthetase TilS [Xanthomonadaceae bacterium]|nr:tRNA lysidine(34) synthetase TilS [Xanthomonadaceae bacterium]